ncbi:hypothetical protein F4778DRAFT_783164 [Xylariomycetidae sp. FL2044]|nr:hypothetical protein F4778DRAFT_783164 [Xylariomycetidae sp. FL2044]
MTAPGTSIAVIGTFDTKLEEFLYLRSRILQHSPSADVLLVDAGRDTVSDPSISIPQSEVLKAGGYSQDESKPLTSLPRGEVVKIMIAGSVNVVKHLYEQKKIHGIISLGGSGGTSIAAAVMRELPIAFPKLIVSTVASSDTSIYVGETDITMMYSVVDIAGLNEVLKAVVDNAAAAIVGMSAAYANRMKNGTEEVKKKGIGVTMFGVTTPAVDVARKWLEEQGFEVYVFHATGSGGKAMERIAMEGRLAGVLDLTTTELADELVGGVFSAGDKRLTGAAKAGIPQVVSVGALDMVNFGPKDSVPQDFRERTLFEHNPSVTLMRTTPQECEELGGRIASRLKANCSRPDLTEVWLPLKGVSAIAVEGQAFHDPKADEALFGAIKNQLSGSGINVVEADSAINEPAWAHKTAQRLKEIIDNSSQ